MNSAVRLLELFDSKKQLMVAVDSCQFTWLPLEQTSIYKHIHSTKDNHHLSEIQNSVSTSFQRTLILYIMEKKKTLIITESNNQVSLP